MANQLSEIRDKFVTWAQAAWATKSPNVLAYFPQAILVGQLPLAIISLRGATYDSTEYGIGTLVEGRNMAIILHVAKLTMSQVGQAERELEEYIELFIQYFGERQYMTLDDGTQVEVTITGDQGPQQLVYGDTANDRFIGTTFEFSFDRVYDIDPVV